jgi:5-methylcytosine-specific restriction protein A
LRRDFPNKVKLAAWDRCGGNCESCGMKIIAGAQYDHVLPDWLGGEPTLENCECLCSPCHRIKTKDDVARIARTKRQKNAAANIKKKSTMPGSKNSPWKKTLDGRTVRR